MDIIQPQITLHPQLFQVLFAQKSKTRTIFNDVLALYDIHHIAMATISPHQELLCLSSTPSLEYNLLNGSLWRFDNSYNLQWLQQYTQASWQSLYAPERYDELYYLKQIKPRYPIGVSLAAKIGHYDILFSIASCNDNADTRHLFKTQTDSFYQIGQYCATHLLPLLVPYDPQLYPSSFERLGFGQLDFCVGEVKKNEE